MKILVISSEVWRDDKNGGNVLSNIFSGMDAEFAQIYCNPGKPSNDLCKKYFQLTDSMIINNIMKKVKVGQAIEFLDYPKDNIKNDKVIFENKRLYSFVRKFRLESFLVAKEILWNISNWQNNELEKFIVDFNPDIIFAPCYASNFMLKLSRYVKTLVKKPMISYISDDNYSLKQFRISPVYWINRLILRKDMRKTFPYYDLVYTMTNEQLKECEKAFNCKLKILRKSEDFNIENAQKPINSPIKIIYAGGIYCGRWKTLLEIAKAIKNINKDSVKIQLHIYTGNELTKKQMKILNDERNSFVCGLVSQRELKQIYTDADIALHTESFDLKNKLLTRISFSTKIIDCLSSSCAVMVISWNKHSGYIYLKSQDAAFCISNKQDIEKMLRKICENPTIISKYRQKAFECGKKNHQKEIIKQNLIADFNRIYEMSRE